MPQFPELYILRHGQTEWNVLGKYQGQMDSPLTKPPCFALRAPLRSRFCR